MRLIEALKLGKGLARRFHVAPDGATIEITSDGSRFDAYPPLVLSDADQMAINVRSAKPSEANGHEDWEPFDQSFKPPETRCEACGTKDVIANLTCRKCGRSGCFNCISIDIRLCRHCFNSQGY